MEVYMTSQRRNVPELAGHVFLPVLERQDGGLVDLDGALGATAVLVQSRAAAGVEHVGLLRCRYNTGEDTTPVGTRHGWGHGTGGDTARVGTRHR